MEVTLHIPDEVAQRLAVSGSDLSRPPLDAFPLEEYRPGRRRGAQLLHPPRLELLQGKGFQGAAGEVAPRNGEPLRDFVWDMQGHFHFRSLTREALLIG